jgi:hypothetical protein
MNSTKIACAIALAAMCATLSACGTTVRYTNRGSVETAKKTGPPPHAPAHGYRHKHGDTVLVFDSSLEVYVVSGHKDYYFQDSHYYHSTGNGWKIATRMDGPWKSVSTKKLPKGLRNSQQAKKGKAKGKKKK